MSMLVCPLCGKSTSLGLFDPSGFEDDICVQTVRGLGRGRGFEVVSRESVLGDKEVTPRVSERVMDIVSMLLRRGCLDQVDILSRLGISIEDAQRDADIQKEKADALQERLDETDEELAEMIDSIDEVIPVEEDEQDSFVEMSSLEEEERDNLKVLRERLHHLINEYEALAAESESDNG